jgi:hypothetical protein
MQCPALGHATPYSAKSPSRDLQPCTDELHRKGGAHPKHKHRQVNRALRRVDPTQPICTSPHGRPCGPSASASAFWPAPNVTQTYHTSSPPTRCQIRFFLHAQVAPSPLGMFPIGCLRPCWLYRGQRPWPHINLCLSIVAHVTAVAVVA